MKVRRSKPRVKPYRYVVSLTGAPSILVESHSPRKRSALVARYQEIIKIQSTEGMFKVRELKNNEKVKVNAHNIVLGTMPSIMPAYESELEEFGDDDED